MIEDTELYSALYSSLLNAPHCVAHAGLIPIQAPEHDTYSSSLT